jgi:hypothetical protein
MSMRARWPKQVPVWLIVAGLVIGGLCGQVLAAEPQTGRQAGTWTGGAAFGILGNTPDGTALGLNFNAEAFLHENISLGPLVQLGFTGDMTLVGASAQGKYWIDLPDTKVKLNLQAGVGFVHADMFGRDDTSFLIPIGIGVDYKLNETIALTSTFMLNFTDLSVAGNRTTVMPGWTVGFRF